MHTCYSHLEPLWLMELDSGFALTKEPGEVTGLDLSLLVENLLSAVDTADNIDIPAVLQTLRAQTGQVILAEEGVVVRDRAGVSPLEVKGFLLPVVPEEDLRLQGLDEAPEQAGRTVETQRGRSVNRTALLRRQRLVFAPRPLHCLSFALLWHFRSREKIDYIN